MLIGRNSNKQFGFKAKNQDFYFHRVSERNGFPIHLSISRWQKKNTQLRKNKRYRETISKRKDVPGEVFSKKAFKGISAAHKVTFGRSRMNETETRAVGVLYMMNLVWKTIQEQRADSNFKRDSDPGFAVVLRAGFCLFSLLDDSDQMHSRSIEGKKGNKKLRFKKAAEITERMVRLDFEIETNVLSKRILERIKRDCTDDNRPSLRWIEDKIQEIKKSLRRK
jgi:hypothetical protein